MRFLIFLFCIFTASVAFSQNHELLRSRGLLPKNIVGTAQQQKAYEYQKRKKNGEVLGTDQYTIIDGTVNLCQRIAASGRLMVNDTLSSYANKVLDMLLKDEPELRKKLCVYFYYSEGTNAVTLDNGMIIIQLGLFAHMENEAQLAFVLSHEVSHYRQNHFLKYLRYTKDLKNDNDPMASVLSYSRELEEEADSIGFEIYKKAGYPLSEAVTVFDMLKYSDLPEAQVPFNMSFFEHGDYKFPGEYFEEELFDVEVKEIDESKSTHPSCDKRMDHMQTLLGDQDPYGNYFPISQTIFNALRLIAREECCALYLEDRDYGNAIYSAYALLQEDSTNANAKKLLAKGLYNLAAYSVSNTPDRVPKAFIVDYDQEQNFNFKSDGDEYMPVTPYQDVAGESQKMHYFLTQMSGKELAVLALDWNWKLYSESNHQDRLLGKMCDNLFFILDAYHDTRFKDFTAAAIAKRKAEKDSVAKTPPEDPETAHQRNLDRLKRIDNIDKLSDDDIDKLLAQAARKEKEGSFSDAPERDYYYYAFDVTNDTLFILKFKENSYRDRFSDLENVWATSEKFRKSSKGLGIKNMYLMPPNYYRLKEIKRSHRYDYDKDASKQLQQATQTQLASTAKATQKGYFMITPQVMDSTRVADYNTYCMLQQWLDEQTSHSTNRLALNLSHAELVDSLTKKLGTHYIMISSVVCEKQKRVRNVATYVLACLFPYTMPIAVIYGVIPKNRSHLLSFVYDIDTGELVFMYEDYTKTKATPPRMNMYYTKVFAKTGRKP